MPGVHIPAPQKQHAFRQGSAGVHWKVIQKNQLREFGTRAPVMSRQTIMRTIAGGFKTAAELRVRRTRPGSTLTGRHRRLLRDAMQQLSENWTEELSAMLGREEAGVSQRTDFARSTIDDFLRNDEQMTSKVLTVYDPRKDVAESARCRSALRRYPLRCLVVIDASHVDTRKDSARRRGRAKRGKRAFARQFLSSDGKLRSVMGVMTMNGMEVDACGFLEGGVTEAKYLTWFKSKVMPMLNRWDPDNPAPNSIVRARASTLAFSCA